MKQQEYGISSADFHAESGFVLRTFIRKRIHSRFDQETDPH